MFRVSHSFAALSKTVTMFRHICRGYSTIGRNFKEVKIPVPWGHVAGKWWAPFDKRPILTVHGWQDNCGSFDRLIPLLTQDVGFLAIDLPGHGYSSRLPPGIFSHNINYPILIRQLREYFKWPQVTLMGHSLGGISCALFTMIFPDMVDFLICIDGVKPPYKKDNMCRMGLGIEEFLKYEAHCTSLNEPPSYTMDQLKELVCQPNNNSISKEYSHHLLERNIAPSKVDPNKYYFTRDPRLKSRLILNWPSADILEGGERVKCPIFMCKATNSSYYEDKQNFYDVLEVLKKASSDCQYHYVEGTHHLHLNNPEVLSHLLNNFILKHNGSAERHTGGGISKDILAVSTS